MTHRIADSTPTEPPPTEEDVGRERAPAASGNAGRVCEGSEIDSDDPDRADPDAGEVVCGHSDDGDPTGDGPDGDDVDSEEASDTVDSETSGRSAGKGSAVRGLRRPGAAAIGAALIVVVLAGLSAAAIALGIAHRDSDRAGEHDLAVLGAARQGVVNLISPSDKDPVGSANRIAADATGQWLTEFRAVKDKFVGAIGDSKTDSAGEILGAGIEHHNPDGSTTVLVTAVSKVSNAAGAKDDPRTWRLRVDVVEEATGYKLSKVEVVP
ncbi:MULTISPECIES: hypothetical protein [Nocardia]|jgi:Mce-associated membrane protein|uniref:Mce-associated membrane protein n=1 Tax=Nocardia elegans TaxID=300029 RepID=A0ABW6THN7_9NOCA|nr:MULTISPECIES: hypothetical protein [Nocardia]